ncbi:hypothetical protein AYO43_04235 [Nitrospira sp. SCGC AG-212-E16]|nr:hypothetical protein AYO43_04235 [Nitrospira sp. SCGC AG-212-E16]
MAQVVKVEVGQRGQFAGPIKGVPDIVVASSLRIVKDPRHVWPGSEPAEQAPERFIERERSRRPVLGLFQADKSMRHIHGLPGEGQQLFLAHPSVDRREHDRLQRILTGREEPIGFRRSRQIPQPAGWFLIFLNGGQFFPCGLA